jgi:hypothetical protein
VIRTYKYLKEEILFDQLLAFFQLQLGLIKIKLRNRREEKGKRREGGGVVRGGFVMD